MDQNSPGRVFILSRAQIPWLQQRSEWPASLLIFLLHLTIKEYKNQEVASEDSDFIHLFLLFCCRSTMQPEFIVSQIRNPQGNCNHSSPFPSDRCRWHNRPPNPERWQTDRVWRKNGCSPCLHGAHLVGLQTCWLVLGVWRRGWDRGPGLHLTFPPLTQDSGFPPYQPGLQRALSHWMLAHPVLPNFQLPKAENWWELVE